MSTYYGKGASAHSLSFILSGESKSVYVRNLPSTVTSADIEQEFMNFGRIKPDGIFIRNRKVIVLFCPYITECFHVYTLKDAKIASDIQEIGVCYAFVEFEDIVGVQNAIKV